MGKKGPDYEARGVEVLGSEANWVRVGWSNAEVLIAERKSEDRMLIVRLGDDIEETADEVVAQVVDAKGDLARTYQRLERILRDVDAEDLLLIDPGRGSKCDPVLITRERRRLVTWQRVEDRRSKTGWRWEKGVSCFDTEMPYVFFDGETGEVSVTTKVRKTA